MLESHTCLYSQHIPGVLNTIADALSRRFDLSNEELTNLINSSCLPQGLPSLKICQVHPEISSWMTYWLQKNKEMMMSLKMPKIKKQECGEDGHNMQSRLDFSKTSGSQISYQSSAPTLWEPLPQHSAEDTFLDLMRKTWLLQQSKRPWQNWVRPLGQMWGTTPHMDMDHSHYTPYLPGSSKECGI